MVQQTHFTDEETEAKGEKVADVKLIRPGARFGPELSPGPQII